MNGPSVCLIAPPNTSMADPRIAPPLGLLYLAAAQIAAGFDPPTVIDLNTACYQPDAPKGHPGGNTHDFSIERCMAEIPHGMDVYGLSVASMQMEHAVPILKMLRKRSPRALLVVGGAHASAAPEDFVGLADVVIRYEGEGAWVKLLGLKQACWEFYMGVNMWEPEFPGVTANYPSPMDGIPHITMIVNGKQVDPLDAAPIPARHLLDFSNYTRRIAGKPATNIITSRGCPARCMYCQQEDLWGKGLRLQSPARILAEVDDIYRTTGIRNLLFLDDSLTACSTARMSELCRGLKERGVEWRGWTRANLIARDDRLPILKEMRASGFVSCCVGVEAGTDKLLKAIDKGTTTAQNSAAIRNLKAAGIKARTSIMVGLPGETWADVQALVEWVAKEQPDDWILSSLVPLPGTPSWSEAERFGIRIDREKVKRRNYADVFVVGGDETSGQFHDYAGVSADGLTGPRRVGDRYPGGMSRPCKSCPFQPTAFRGLWHPSHYLLIAYLGSVRDWIPGCEQLAMNCHQRPGNRSAAGRCGGWARAARESLPVCIGVAFGKIDQDAYDDTPVLSPEEMARVNGLDMARIPPLSWSPDDPRYPSHDAWVDAIIDLRAKLEADPEHARSYVLPGSPLDVGPSPDEVVEALGPKLAAVYASTALPRNPVEAP